MAGTGQMNHSDAGPNRSTTPLPKMPSAIPNKNNTRRNETTASPKPKKGRPKTVVARRSITASPTMLDAVLDSTRPLTYSVIDSGDAKIFRKLRDHTSSMKVNVTPCMTRVKKSHSRTAPRSTGTKLKPDRATVLRYLVMNPHSTMSTATHTNSGNTRARLPRIK